ncbi:MAG: nucleoside deaminase [Candidatus Aenigmatarchaeota archaeon]
MNKFIFAAITEARKGVKLNHGGPFGAVIVHNGKIISTAHNEVVKTNDPTAHAEINAIRNAAKKLKTFDLSGCVIYTTCEPCPMCLAAICWANINKFYHGCTAADAAKIGFRDKKIYSIVRGSGIPSEQMHRNECLVEFAKWRRMKGRVLY